MSDADRIARELRLRNVAENEQFIRSGEEAARDEHAELVAEAEDLIWEAMEMFKQDPTATITPFRVTRKSGSTLFPKDRAGWYIGSIFGGLGHGETGFIPLYLLSTGQFAYGAPGIPGAVINAVDLAFFESSSAQLRDLVRLLRKVVNPEPEPVPQPENKPVSDTGKPVPFDLEW